MTSDNKGKDEQPPLFVDDTKGIFPSRKYIIRNEETVWQAITDIIESNIDFYSVAFQGWDYSELHIDGPKYNATLSFSAMQYLCAIQKRIYGSYALAKYGTYDSKKLSAEERESLEIYVSLGYGSTRIMDILNGLVEPYLTEIASKVTGKQVVLTALVGLAVWGGISWHKASLDHKIQVKRLEIESENNKQEAEFKLQMLADLRYAKEVDEERFKLLAALSTSNADVAKIVEEGESLQREKLKLAAKTDFAKTKEVAVPGYVANQLLKSHRQTPLPVQLNDIYRIDKTNHQPEDGHILTLTNIKTGMSFPAFLPNLLAAGENQEIIANAYRKMALGVYVSAYVQQGKIKDAQITGFYPYKPLEQDIAQH